MTTYITPSEDEARQILKTAGVPFTRVLVDGDDVIAYIIPPLNKKGQEVAPETILKHVTDAGGAAFQYSDQHKILWFRIPAQELPDIERELLWQPPVPTAEERL